MRRKTLRQLVIDALDAESGIAAAGSGSAMGGGVTTRQGHVPDHAREAAAERVAWPGTRRDAAHPRRTRTARRDRQLAARSAPAARNLHDRPTID